MCYFCSGPQLLPHSPCTHRPRQIPQAISRSRPASPTGGGRVPAQSAARPASTTPVAPSAYSYSLTHTHACAADRCGYSLSAPKPCATPHTFQLLVRLGARPGGGGACAPAQHAALPASPTPMASHTVVLPALTHTSTHSINSHIHSLIHSLILTPAPVRPMQLVEVYVVRLQSCQGVL